MESSGVGYSFKIISAGSRGPVCATAFVVRPTAIPVCYAFEDLPKMREESKYRGMEVSMSVVGAGDEVRWG